MFFGPISVRLPSIPFPVAFSLVLFQPFINVIRMMFRKSHALASLIQSVLGIYRFEELVCVSGAVVTVECLAKSLIGPLPLLVRLRSAWPIYLVSSFGVRPSTVMTRRSLSLTCTRGLASG